MGGDQDQKRGWAEGMPELRFQLGQARFSLESLHRVTLNPRGDTACDSAS